MINKTFLAIVITLLSSCASGQEVFYPIPNDSSIIKLKSFYNGYGKVFKSESEANRDIFGNKYPGDFIEGFEKDLNLTIDQIIEAEKLLSEQIEIKELKNYYRQYLGFLNNEGDNIILINLLNFKNKNKSEKYFEHWKNSFLTGHGKFYEQNQQRFLVNLSKELVTAY